MSFIIKKASKQAKKLRILLSASSGSGKTYSALELAYGMCENWDKICVIDTERDSASLYADKGEFNTISLSEPYSPERCIEAIHAAEQAGMEVIIFDSITHEWDGPGGCLDIHAKLGGTFQNWSVVTPKHNKFISAILSSPCHIICTVRRKEEYALSTVGTKIQVEKLGMKEITRDGFNYEVDLVFEITNTNHMAVATKDRTNLFVGSDPFLITKETGKQLKDWGNKGRSEIDDALEMIRNSKDEKELTSIYNSYVNLKTNEDFIGALKVKKESFKK